MKGYRKFFVCMLCTMVFSCMLSLMPSVFLQVWSRAGEALSLHKILFIAALLLLTNFINALLIFYRENFAEKFNKSNANAYLRKFLAMRYDRILEQGPTNLLERISTAVNSIYRFMTGGAIQIWSSVILAAAGLALMSRVSLLVSLLMAAYIPLTVLGFRLINKELSKRSMELQTQTGAGFQELISYIREPDYFKQLPDQEAMLRKMAPALDKVFHAMARINKFAQTSSVALSSMGTILQNLIMLYVIFSFMELQLSPYMLMLATLIIPLYFGAVGAITGAKINKTDYTAALALGKALDADRETEGTEKIDRVETLAFDLETIEIGEKKLPFAAKALLKKGDIGRIYGPSGSGKSTLAKSVLRFRKTNGIKINGVDVETIENASLRSVAEYVSQNLPLIKGTLRENLLFGKENIPVADAFLKNHPLLQSIFAQKTLDDEILEGGANLSGGEKQKIALVRALLSRPQILVLDEVCSSIDEKTAAEIYGMLKADAANRITIVISHDALPEGFTNVDINLPA